MKYPVVLERNPETGVWIAEVPGIAGAYSQGRDRQEALDHVREALLLVLEEHAVPDGYTVEFASVEA